MLTPILISFFVAPYDAHDASGYRSMAY
jgi:hypothetical protein